MIRLNKIDHKILIMHGVINELINLSVTIIFWGFEVKKYF